LSIRHNNESQQQAVWRTLASALLLHHSNWSVDSTRIDRINGATGSAGPACHRVPATHHTEACWLHQQVYQSWQPACDRVTSAWC